MHQALTTTELEGWYREHETAWCHRFSSRITLTACRKNRVRSMGACGDNRCAGCGGLDSQPDPNDRQKPVLTVIDGGRRDPLNDDLMQALHDVLDGIEETDEEPAGFPVDLSLYGAGLDEEYPLAALLLSVSELDDGLEEEEELEEIEPERPELVDPPERARRYQVYTGRCQRCEGYMMRGEREGRNGVVDHDVYRCFNCGWRVSPAYADNRKHHGVGWR